MLHTCSTHARINFRLLQLPTLAYKLQQNKKQGKQLITSRQGREQENKVHSLKQLQYYLLVILALSSIEVEHLDVRRNDAQSIRSLLALNAGLEVFDRVCV